jgi:hypothetical protein
MADKEYEYRITSITIEDKLTKTIWFRSTNYTPMSPYGWDTLTTSYPTDECELVAAVKQLGNMWDCELIPARAETIDTMFTGG